MLNSDLTAVLQSNVSVGISNAQDIQPISEDLQLLIVGTNEMLTDRMELKKEDLVRCANCGFLTKASQLNTKYVYQGVIEVIEETACMRCASRAIFLEKRKVLNHPSKGELNSTKETE